MPNHLLTKQFFFQVRDNFTSPTNDVVLGLRQVIVPSGTASGKLDQLLLKRPEQIGDKVALECVFIFAFIVLIDL